MTTIRAHFFGAMLAFAAILAASLPAMAQRLITQEPCTPVLIGDGYCTTLTPDEVGPRTIRSLSFTTQRPGRALVQFDGTASCISANFPENTQFDFDTQIVTDPDANVVPTGPGGARYRQFLGEKGLNPAGAALNLSSSRVITIAEAGQHSVHLRIRPTVTETGAHCRFYQNRFTVLFLPS